MHHSQAVEMTALIPSHTDNKDLRSLGARISSSQSDEIKFMKRWLAARGEPTSMSDARYAGHGQLRQAHGPHARHADARTDGRAAQSQGRRV